MNQQTPMVPFSALVPLRAKLIALVACSILFGVLCLLAVAVLVDWAVG